MKISSVIVTYNRKDCLDKLLSIYNKLDDVPNDVIIVNNNSNDGTNELLDKWINTETIYRKQVINMEKNLGGSGGFYIGLEKAIETDAEWVYVSDDDAFPNNNIYSEFKKYLDNNKHRLDEIAAVCGKVINKGNIDVGHRRRINKGILRIKEFSVNVDEYKHDEFEIDLFSYVGTFINVSYLKKYGLTEKDYFIYYDDTEHSLRLSKYGKIICVPSIVVTHDTPENSCNALSWKYYYGYRNKLLMIKKHYGNKYFKIQCLRFKLLIIKRKLMNQTAVAELIKKSILDAKNNKVGIDNMYKPGWK